MKLNGLGTCFYLIITLLTLPPSIKTWASIMAYADSTTASNEIKFDHLEQDIVYFKAPRGAQTPKPFKTGLYNLTYIGQLTPDEGTPYLLFSGKPCQSCLDETNIYAIRPNDSKPTAFIYPGKILDPRSRATLLESRAFFGKCLNRFGDAYVVFQREKIDRRHSLQSSVLVAEAAKDHLAENLIERHLPRLKTTLQFVKRKSCHEIPGRSRLMLSKPLDLHPHNNSDDDDDDDDDTPSSSKGNPESE